MTSQGSSYGRFVRALASGNPTLALVAAGELPHLGLGDALALCLVLRADSADRYSRAAARWHTRFCAEERGITVSESQLVLAALASLPGPDATAGALALVGTFEARARPELADVVRGAFPAAAEVMRASP